MIRRFWTWYTLYLKSRLTFSNHVNSVRAEISVIGFWKNYQCGRGLKHSCPWGKRCREQADQWSMTTNLCHACTFAAKVPVLQFRLFIPGGCFSVHQTYTHYSHFVIAIWMTFKSYRGWILWSFKKSTEYSSIRNIASQYKPYNRSDIWNWHPFVWLWTEEVLWTRWGQWSLDCNHVALALWPYGYQEYAYKSNRKAMSPTRPLFIDAGRWVNAHNESPFTMFSLTSNIFGKMRCSLRSCIPV